MTLARATRLVVAVMALAAMGACQGEVAQVTLSLSGDASGLLATSASAVVSALDARRRDGTPLQCADLLAGQATPFDLDVELLAQEVFDLQGAMPSDGGDVDVPAGAARMVLVELYDAQGGLGRTTGRGCAGPVRVDAGGRTDVDISLQPVP
jgi:hypothetical protein